MSPLLDLTILEPHMQRLKEMLASGTSETAAYMLLGASQIQADPWSAMPRTRLVSRQFHAIDRSCSVSATSASAASTARPAASSSVPGNFSRRKPARVTTAVCKA